MLSAACLIASSIAGCASSSGSFCAAAFPIRPAKGETARLSPQLKAQILQHFETGQRLCGWKP